MGTIVVSENITLDGVVEDPTGEEGFRHGGWFNQIGDEDRAAWAKEGLDEALGAEAFLLGRRSYEYLAARWPSRTGEWADRLNAMPKYVVSSTLTDPEWNNTTVLRSLDEVAELKKTDGGPILVHGSPTLAKGLAAAGLVDRYHLLIFPLVLGGGKRLFTTDGADKQKLTLVEHATYSNGIQLAVYDVKR